MKAFEEAKKDFKVQSEKTNQKFAKINEANKPSNSNTEDQKVAQLSKKSSQ